MGIKERFEMRRGGGREGCGGRGVERPLPPLSNFPRGGGDGGGRVGIFFGGGVHGERLEAAAARGETRGQSSLRGHLGGAAARGGGGWTPDRVTVVWSRRHRRVCSKVAAGHPEPAAGNGRVGAARDPRGGRDPVPGPPCDPPVTPPAPPGPQAATFDDKSWNFLVLNESRGRRSVVAGAPLELGRLAGVGDTALSLSLRPRSPKVTAATLRLRLRGLVLLEGHPTDEDMQSVTSLSPPGDVADLGDFESDPEEEGGAHRAGVPPRAPRWPPPGGP
ncbi:EH domain-binding protein 1-like protein 1 [Corvus cornix cornix]|uniref:EH domain-binding protein 1-like protein 1 n=1 Tax=Corvus cornix cornix TaxID=932674 RepID=UPI00194E2189|nr:EH domain-binding protein 1-like protein 1 [Corvus cornix cornix]